jgi:Rad3-related DNA helicase
MSALNWFRGDPRPEQVKILEELMRVWDEYSCFVIQAPVATGKSRVAVAVARWAESFEQRVTIVPPDSVLQRQYEGEFPELASLWGADNYRCHDFQTSCGERKKKAKGGCKGCPHNTALGATRASFLRLEHTYTYLGLRKSLGYPRLAIFDEAHKLIDFQQNHIGVKFWQKQHQWPLSIETVEDVIRWIDKAQQTYVNYDRTRARKLILNNPDNILIEKKLTTYRGRDEWQLRIYPLTVRDVPPFLWPKSVKKVILMSATISPKDIEELGIDRYHRVAYIESDSPIHPMRREIHYAPCVNMAHRNKETAIPELAALLNQMADHHQDAGLIHATYEDASLLRKYLTNPRFLWHDRTSKNHIYNSWVSGSAGRGRILVGSGLTEGVDLAGDRARWQVITKVPFPNLGEPAVALKVQQDPEWYDWSAIKTILQAVGRVCRGPDDFGVTYIVDSQFKPLYERRQYLFPSHVRDSIRWHET